MKATFQSLSHSALAPPGPLQCWKNKIRPNHPCHQDSRPTPVRDRYSNIRREEKIFCCWAANSHQQWQWAVDQIFGWAGTRLCFNKYWLHCDEWLITLAAPRGAIFRILHYSSQQQPGTRSGAFVHIIVNIEAKVDITIVSFLLQHITFYLTES